MLVKQTEWDRALKYIPDGCQTLSKAPKRYVDGVYPKLLVSGHGCEVLDEEGKIYIDYISGLGTNLLGYNHPSVDDAVKESIIQGQILLSLPHPKEGELAEKLCGILRKDQVKFFKTGSEATSAAVRVARAYTRKDTILMCGYNGWHDWAGITYDRLAGIPNSLNEHTKKFKYNDLASLEKCFQTSSAAAIILEPVVFDEPKNGFLESLVSLAHRNGSLVIFDEIVTGFRFGIGGAASLLNIESDIKCIGKSLGNGYAIAGVLGNREIMSTFERDDFIASGTFSGELTGISAAIAVLDELKWNPKPHLWEMGTILKTGFNNISQELNISANCVGYAPRTKFIFPTDGHKALFWQECVKRGVIFGHANFVTYSHGHVVLANTLGVCREALKKVKEYWSDPKSALEGTMPVAVIR